MADGCFYQANFAQTNFIQPCPPIPPPAPSDLGGAGFVSGTGAFHPDKYYRAFHRFLGIARKKGRKEEHRELRDLRRIAGELKLKAAELARSEALIRQAEAEFSALKAEVNRQAHVANEIERQRQAAVAERLAEAMAKYEKLEAQRIELERIEQEAEENAVVHMLLMEP